MMFMTQRTSKVRVKHEVYGELDFHDLYKAYDQLELREFKDYCIDLIQIGTGRQLKKDEICGAVEESKSKDRALKLTNDFILAGQGLGV